MMKSKLFKAFLLGIGLSAFMTNMAFAQSIAVTAAPPTRGVVLSDEQIALYAKQKDVDQYLFADHASDIKDKGFVVNYTVVNGDAVEIGISPYSQDNADYLYGIFGKDGISVVKAADNVLYSTDGGTAAAGVGTAEPGVIVNTAEPVITDPQPIDAPAAGTDAVDPTMVKGSTDPVAADGSAAGTLNDTDQIYTTTAVEGTAAPVTKGEAAPTAANADDGKMTIQIESAAPATSADDSSVMYETTAAGAGQPDSGIRTVSAAESINPAASNEGKDNGAVDTSMIVLAIAGVAILIGGGIIVSNKKRNK